jgi:hypothetical protein
MAKQNEHGRLIAAAAKAALSPLGCKRVGQSRCWISDQRYWIIFIEFQPSAWSRGSYLNVTPRWLWLRMGSGESSERVADFIPFENAGQFTPLIERMAAQAAEEVLSLRAKFRSLSDIDRYLAGRMTRDGWPVYRAAVTAALVGDTVTARRLFQRMELLDANDYDPWIRLKAESARMAVLVDNPALFRSVIEATINELRQGLRLPPDPRCLEELDARAVQ